MSPGGPSRIGASPPRRAPARESPDGAPGEAEAGPAFPDGFVAGSGDRAALLVLLGLPSLTPRRFLALAEEHPTASACLAAVRAGRAVSPRDREVARDADPGALAERVEAAGARLVALGDGEYPSDLLDLFDPPAGFFAIGRALHPDVRRVAIVGARNCSLDGREIAFGLASAVAAAGGAVVSGAARGIDGAAHRGALAAGGWTVAVLGSGIDVPYPRANRGLLAEIARTGTILSEYPPGARAEPFRFPARNRLVAALAAAIVVVEGAEGSGSLITAEHALEIGRDVLAVPGAVTSPLAAVPLALIREGAGLVRNPDDLLHETGLVLDGPPVQGTARAVAEGTGDATDGWVRRRPPGGRRSPGGKDEQAVWDALVAPAAPDRVARLARISLPAALRVLGSLELDGLVRQVGGRYERCRATW